MEISSSTHWYVIKFLAHIIAYQDYVGKEAHEQKLLAIPAKSGQSVKSISKKYHLILNSKLSPAFSFSLSKSLSPIAKEGVITP